MTTHHDYTQHGYPCCELATNDPPPLVALCDGPGGLCRQCNLQTQMMHALRPFKAPDAKRAADYLAGQKRERADVTERLRALGSGRSVWSLDEIANFLETFPFHPRPSGDDDD